MDKTNKIITLALLFVLICLVITSAMAVVLALDNIGKKIGYVSAIKLSTCHFTINDKDCIGSDKAKILSDYYNDNKDTHGVSISRKNK